MPVIRYPQHVNKDLIPRTCKNTGEGTLKDENILKELSDLEKQDKRAQALSRKVTTRVQKQVPLDYAENL